MSGQPERGPSEAERLQAEYPHVSIWRDLHDDGSHGDWVAELRLTVRAGDLETLRSLLARAQGLGSVGRPRWARTRAVAVAETAWLAVMLAATVAAALVAVVLVRTADRAMTTLLSRSRQSRLEPQACGGRRVEDRRRFRPP